MIASMNTLVGQGVDFAAVGHVLVLVLAVYVAASLLAWLQGYLLNDVVQRTIYRMRADVEDKVNALPLTIRPAAARRAAQSGHQRHRQHQPDPAADHEPADGVAADRGRRARDAGGGLACCSR